ncbi:P-loop containing nucleoside triphosphate hydrolase protein, partial [Rhizoctonia solani]
KHANSGLDKVCSRKLCIAYASENVFLSWGTADRRTKLFLGDNIITPVAITPQSSLAAQSTFKRVGDITLYLHADTQFTCRIDLKEFDMDDITLQRTNNHIVAFNRRFPHAPGALYDVQFVLNPVPFQRMIQALNVTPKRLEILFPQVEDVTASSIAVQNLEEPEIELYNHIISSNYEQYNAVSKVVGLPPGSPPFIVFGPPGTGKTVTIVECISQLLNDENVRVLACAPSNSPATYLLSGSEPEVMIPILTMSGPDTNVVLSGDPKQLGPVIRSPVARTLGMNISYLDRLMESPTYDEVTMRGISVVKLLQNFRSHERIISFPNEEFYRNELVAHAPASVADSLLSWNGLASPDFPVVFEAVRGRYARRKSPSYFNPHEASLVKEYVQGLLPFIASSRNIGIVTPYKAQVRKIRKLLKDNDIADIDIGSVEQFQGQERQVIIVSTVRSNKDLLSFDLKHTLGFVSNPKRLERRYHTGTIAFGRNRRPARPRLDALWRRFMYFVYRSGGWKGAPFPWSPDADPDDDPATFDAAERDLRDLLRRATEVGSPSELDPIGTGNE